MSKATTLLAKLYAKFQKLFSSAPARIKFLQSSSSQLPPQGDAGVLALGHREYVGGLWDEMGKLQFDFLISQGLKMSDTFIDVACGSLRLGVHIIPYLDVSNYLGIEKEESLIRAGLSTELDASTVSEKKPVILCNDNFEFDRFERVFDMGIAQSLFTHLPPDLIIRCLKNLRPHMSRNSAFFATYFKSDIDVDNPHEPHDHGYFAYTKHQMEEFGLQSGFSSHYIGDWNHPRGQVMVVYRPRY